MSVEDPKSTEVIEPGHTFSSVTDKISTIVLTRKTPLGWFLADCAKGDSLRSAAAIEPSDSRPLHQSRVRIEADFRRIAQAVAGRAIIFKSLA